MTALFAFKFACLLLLSLMASFMTYLLEDQYGQNEDDAAKITGDVGFVADIVTLCFEVFVSASLDIFGRKYITIGGLLVASLSMFFIT